MINHSVKFILTDIEGTTTSVSFVYDVLFPYFREHLSEVKDLQNHPVIKEAIEQTKVIVREEEGRELGNIDEVIEVLTSWSKRDRKITPLKSIQGVIWQKGYENGTIKGHVYPEVKTALENWKDQGMKLGVFSSGSIAAQKLIFGYSEAGDLTSFFSSYFDTTTGGKRETETYDKIAVELKLKPENILFLSDIREELEAADNKGFKTIQLVRPGTAENWKNTAKDFLEIKFN